MMLVALQLEQRTAAAIKGRWLRARTRPAKERKQSVFSLYTPDTVTGCSSWLSSDFQRKGDLNEINENERASHLHICSMKTCCNLGKIYLLKWFEYLLCIKKTRLGWNWLTQPVSPWRVMWWRPHLQQHSGSPFVEWVTNENMQEMTGGGGRRQEPEWLTAEERRQEKKRGVMV